MEKIYHIAFWWLALIPVVVSGNNNIEECKKYLEAYVEKMSSFSEPGDKVYYLDFELINKYKQKDIPYPSKLEAQIFITKGKLIYKTPIVSVYLDLEDSFVVLHDQKKILWNDGTNLEAIETYKSSLISFQKEFISNSFIYCKDSIIGGRPMKFIRLDMDVLSSLSNNNVERVIYHYDTLRNFINHSEIYYKNHISVSSQIYNYKVLDLDYKGMPEGKVSKLIFTSNGKLRKEFYNYSILKDKQSK